jgi:hypothetical protein
MDNILIVDDFFHKFEQRQIEYKVIDRSHLSFDYHHLFAINNDSKSYDLKFKENDPNVLIPSCGVFFHEIIKEGKISSEHFSKEIEKIPTQIKNKFGIDVKNILRMRVNFMTPLGLDPMLYTTPHIDTNLKDCKIFIYYINDSDGDTVIFDEFFQNSYNFDKKTINKRITPKKGRACIFDASRYHAASFPSKKVRAVININFL